MDECSQIIRKAFTMSKKDRNLMAIEEYLGDAFPGLEISSKEIQGTMEERPPQLFYVFQVGDHYFLALVRAVVEEEMTGSLSQSHPSHCLAKVQSRSGPAGLDRLWKDKASSNWKRPGPRLRSWGPANSLQIGSSSRNL